MPQTAVKDRRFLLYGLIIASITFIAFLPSLHNGFVNWDDDRYIELNPDVHGVSAGHIATVFSSSYLNHYLPVTMLSFMGEYSLFKSDPALYHFTNVILHIVNALLLFGLIYALFGNYFVAFLTALLFAVHPLQVESVAWIAERKGVLSATFYFISLFSYVRFRKSGNRAHWAACMLSFVLSLLSKSMAVSLPFVLLLMDYLMGRKVGTKALLEKTPFFILSAIFMFIAYFSRQDSMNLGPHYTPIQCVLGPAYNIVFYLVKTVLPIHLCALYSAGEHDAGLTMKMALSAAAVCGIAAAVYFSRRSSKIVVFGSLFYFVTLLPVLQIVSSGGWTNVADRYTYIPLIGVYFIIATGCSFILTNTFRKQKAARAAIVAGGIALVVILSCLTYIRCVIWHDGFTLWDDVIKTSPSSVAFTNRGFSYASEHNYLRAIEDYNRAIEMNPAYAPIYNNRGNAYTALGDNARAIKDYDQAIALDPKYAQAYGNRGIVFKTAGDFDRAIEDFSQAIRLAPRYAMAYNNLGAAYCYKGEIDLSISAYNRAISLDPESGEAASAFYGRGLALCFKGDLKRAVKDYDRAIKLRPDYAEAYNNRGVALKDMGDLHPAIESFNHAIALNSEYAQAYYGRGLALKAMGDSDHALEDIKKACSLGIKSACDLISNDFPRP
ncbi:MAG: tetratricopeptide repeat protein [Chitinivibrionales bacterium]